MTGPVKDAILSRIGELGVFVNDGTLYFNPCLLRKDEFTTKARNFNYVTVTKEHKTFAPEIGSLCFTFCQVPVIYRRAAQSSMQVTKLDGTITNYNTLHLDAETSSHVFRRTGEIAEITVHIDESILK
jgi:hypothetical protein